MVLQASMGRYKLDVRQGDRNTLPYYNGTLDSAMIDRTDVGLVATAGRVMSLTSNGFLTPGLTAQGIIPNFSISGADINSYPDTQRDRGMPGYADLPSDGIGGPGSPGWPGIPSRAAGASIGGGWATIQHIAAAELSTTQFLASDNNAIDTTGLTVAVTLADYTPGTVLTVVCPSTANGATPVIDAKYVGLLVPVQNAADVVVGYVAPAGAFAGVQGWNTLAFTPHFTPGANLTTLSALDTLTSGVRAAGDVPLA